MVYLSDSQPVVRGQPVIRGHLLSGPRTKANSFIFKDINIQTDQFRQFPFELSVVVSEREAKFLSGPRVCKG